jgi:putative ABC transport system permease protein
MALLRLALRFAFRNRLRSLITALGVASALVAFLLLRTLVANWYSVKEATAKNERFIIGNALTTTSFLYTPQAEKIRALPGVSDVSWMVWFGAYYKDARNRFEQRAVEAESYIRLYPEFAPPAEQLKEWLSDPRGAIVGQQLVDKYGWKIGDNITLTGTYYAGEWPMTLRGIYPGTAGTDRAKLLFHWKYFNEKLPAGNHVHRILARLDHTEVAQDIDALFANSRAPTRTESEHAQEQRWAAWSAALVTGINVASGLILVILVLVLGNSMAMATREATREYAAMRAIGYKARQITGLVLVQGFFVAALGIALGLALTPTVLRASTQLLEDQIGGVWALELYPAETIITALVALAISMLASSVPAWSSGKLTIVDALRRVA